MTKARGDSVPIKKYKMKEGEVYMPYPYGPMPKAKKKKGHDVNGSDISWT